MNDTTSYQTNLHSPIQRLIGRTNELQTLHNLLQNHRLITLLGPGGIGKTRLATEFAYNTFHDTTWPGDAWFVDLCDARTPEEICTKLAEVAHVDLRGLSSSDGITHIGRTLAERPPTLVVIDNFEQLVDYGPDTLSRWLSLAPNLTCIVTSRERLLLHGEASCPIGALSLPSECSSPEASEAVQLMISRVQAHKATFAPDDTQTRTIANIVERLDGLPLAIELAAAQMGIMSPHQLLHHLDRPLSLLIGGPRSASARHRTLRNTLDWSWNLLEDEEQQALAQCSVFRGGWTLDAATAVLKLPATAPLPHQLLRQLHDKSLIQTIEPDQPTDPTRFRFAAVVHEYAAEKLASDSAAQNAVRDRHAQFYDTLGQQLAKETSGPNTAQALRILFNEQENLRKAATNDASPNRRLRIALSLDPLFSNRGPLTPQLQLLNDGIDAAHPDTIDPKLHARALCARGRIQQMLGDLNASHEDFIQAETIAHQYDDASIEAYALDRLGGYHRHTDDPQRAQHFYKRALEIAHAQGDSHDIGAILGNLACLEHELGHDQARHNMEHAISLLEKSGDNRHRGVLLGNLALIDQEHGDFQLAQKRLEEALTIHRSLDHRRFEGIVLYDQGGLCFEQGQLHQAQSLYRDAAALLGEVGDPSNQGLALAALAACTAAIGHYEEGVSIMKRAGTLLANANSAFRGAADLYHVHIDLAKARKLRTSSDPDGTAKANAIAERVKANLDALQKEDHPGAVALERSDDLRLALRLLELALDDVEDAMLVAMDGSWFQIPGNTRHSIAHRPTLQRVFHAIVQRRLSSNPIITDVELLRAGWPGERILQKAARGRLHVAISTLRKLGLKEILIRKDDGYFLDPALPVVQVPLDAVG